MNATTQQKLTRETLGLLGPVLFEPVLDGRTVYFKMSGLQVFRDSKEANVILTASELAWSNPVSVEKGGIVLTTSKFNNTGTSNIQIEARPEFILDKGLVG